MTPIPQAAGTRAVMLFLLVVVGWLRPSVVHAQELNGVKIQVNPDALTILKFNGEVRNFEFGRSDMFTAQVQDDVKLRIKTLTNNPEPTNLTVTEGNRTHVFIIEVVKKIDINTFKGYYDYSDLKALRKMIAAGNKAATPSATAADVASKSGPRQASGQDAPVDTKLSKAETAKAKKAQKAKDQADAAAAKKAQEEATAQKALADKEAREQQARDEAVLREKQQAREDARQKAAAAEAEKKRLKEEKLARAQAEKEEKAKELALEKQNEAALAVAKKRDEDAEKKRIQKEKAAKEQQARRDREIAAAQEKDRKALIAKAAAEKAAEDKKQREAEAARQAQQQQEAEAARQRQQELDATRKAQADAAKKRAAEEAAARKKEAALEAERKRQEEIARKQQEEVEKEQKRQQELEAKRAQDRKAREQAEAEQQRAKAEQAQKRADALIKNPYWRTEWHKKYPKINFGELPPGQMITGEYYLPKDTLANNAAAINSVDMPAMLNKKSNEAGGVYMVLEGISLSGVNCFLRVRVINGSGKDFLVGKMMLSWWKSEGGSFYLTPCYITDFPVIYPGNEATIVYGCRGVNASDKDDFQFSLKERTDDRELSVAFTGKLYNKELNR